MDKQKNEMVKTGNVWLEVIVDGKIVKIMSKF